MSLLCPPGEIAGELVRNVAGGVVVVVGEVVDFGLPLAPIVASYIVAVCTQIAYNRVCCADTYTYFSSYLLSISLTSDESLRY